MSATDHSFALIVHLYTARAHPLEITRRATRVNLFKAYCSNSGFYHLYIFSLGTLM